MNFGDALEALQKGQKVCRTGWNGKDMWLSWSPGQLTPSTKIWSVNVRAFAETLPNKEIIVLPSIVLKTAQNEILIGWLASQTDMLAEDWCLVATPT